MTVEINVVAGDANDCAVWSAVENGIEAVSGHSTIQVRPALSKPLMSDRRILSDAYFPTSRCARCGMPQKFGTLLSRGRTRLGTRIIDTPRGLALRRP